MRWPVGSSRDSSLLITIAKRHRRAFSLVELLVTIAILGTLISLILPAVQTVRESSRNATCRNRARQIGIGLASHEAAHGRLPSGGWGFQWVGDPDRGSGRAQPGGWLFTILPHIEAMTVHNVALGTSPSEKPEALGAMLQEPVTMLTCPSRRPPGLRPFLGQYPLHNATKPALAFKSDFAGCGGDVRVGGGGPEADSPQAIAAYEWPNVEKASGAFFGGSQMRAADFMDGLANTYVAGEKYVRLGEARNADDRDFGDDQAAYIGDDRDIRRWTITPPLRDSREWDAPDSFGSRHPTSWNALFADGSVRSMAFDIDPQIHRSLGNRRDGAPSSAP